MPFEDDNYYESSQKDLETTIEYSNEKDIYLYHFIYILTNENELIKIDNINDLERFNINDVKIRYYFTKVHYCTGEDELSYEYGDLYKIEQLGYFRIGGSGKKDLIDKEKIKKMYENYNENYKNLSFNFTDEEFLNKNKSVILF